MRDKDKQLSNLKDRVKSLQTDSSNTDTALATLEEALSEKVRGGGPRREQLQDWGGFQGEQMFLLTGPSLSDLYKCKVIEAEVLQPLPPFSCSTCRQRFLPLSAIWTFTIKDINLVFVIRTCETLHTLSVFLSRSESLNV